MIDLFVDGDSTRELKYFSWVKNGDKKQCPCNYLNDPDHIWEMPMIFPLSSFFSSCFNKIKNGLWGQDLTEHFELYFPEKVTLPSTFPKILQDFFSEDLDFHVASKKSDWINDIEKPWQKINFDYDHDSLLAEIEKNIESIKDLEVVPGQTKDNEKYYGPRESVWKRYDLIKKTPAGESWQERSCINREHWPVLWNLLNQLPVKNISLVYLGELGPGGFIFPHIDCLWSSLSQSTTALNILYLPVQCDQGTMFKMGNVGLLPLDGSVLLNNKRFTHAIANTGTKTRYTISIFCNDTDLLTLAQRYPIS